MMRTTSKLDNDLTQLGLDKISVDTSSLISSSRYGLYSEASHHDQQRIDHLQVRQNNIKTMQQIKESEKMIASMKV